MVDIWQQHRRPLLVRSLDPHMRVASRVRQERGIIVFVVVEAKRVPNFRSLALCGVTV
jgi:hypothetical protein